MVITLASALLALSLIGKAALNKWQEDKARKAFLSKQAHSFLLGRISLTLREIEDLFKPLSDSHVAKRYIIQQLALTHNGDCVLPYHFSLGDFDATSN